MIEFKIKKTLQSSGGKMQLNVDVTIPKGEFVTLYGKSGAGKTSILRMIAGLMQPEEGKIEVEGTIWYDSGNKISLSPQKRKVGLVFQEYALFPNMTVKENLEYALPKGDSSAIIDELIEIVELGDLKNRKPHSLSGGQQQRAALARSLIQKPQLLLLDEPLSALDAEMRSKLQQYIVRLHREYHLTTIMVSHDVSEILKMSDLVIELTHGKITKTGTSQDVFGHKELSGKFQFTGEILTIEKQDVIHIISVIIGNELVKVVADEKEANKLTIGDKVIVASKAFNPVIKKVV